MTASKAKTPRRAHRGPRTGAGKKTRNLNQALLDRARQIKGLRALAAVGPIDRARIG